MRPLSWLGLLFSLAVFAADPAATKHLPLAERPLRFAKDIEAFEAKEKAVPSPAHAVVLYGSSTLRLWGDQAAVALRPYPVVNHGFGGACTTEVLAYMDRAVLPLHPRVLVFHCGSNDIAAGDPAEAVLGRVREFLTRLRKAEPDCAVILTANTAAPARRKVWAEMRKSNDGLRELAKAFPGVTFLDTNAALTQPDGEPKPGHFIKDGVHPSEAGYQAIAAVLRPAVEAAWNGTEAAYKKR